MKFIVVPKLHVRLMVFRILKHFKFVHETKVLPTRFRLQNQRCVFAKARLQDKTNNHLLGKQRLAILAIQKTLRSKIRIKNDSAVPPHYKSFLKKQKACAFVLPIEQPIIRKTDVPPPPKKQITIVTISVSSLRHAKKSPRSCVGEKIFVYASSIALTGH